MRLKVNGCVVELEAVSSGYGAQVALVVTDEYGHRGRVVLTALRARNIGTALLRAASKIDGTPMRERESDGPRSW